ncbi:MAG: aminotransferase class V-fold PLP-dependent enzyme [Saccharofermentanales bacterium]
MFGKKRIYLDNTATTRTRKEVYKEMRKYFLKEYANPSSIHQDGLIARGSIEMARERIAQVLNCNSEELIFTGSGSESNNLAIRGVANACKDKGRHIISTKIEHSSVIRTCKDLEKKEYEVTYLSVDDSGFIDLKELERSIRPDTVLVSIIYVNNEIGTIQDIERIAEIVKNKGALLHLDGVQALPYIKMDLSGLNADLMSFSGHKLYAPKGAGLLYVKGGTPIDPIIFGGEQEFGIRSGTENVPYIVGLSKAIALNDKEKKKYVEKLTPLRDHLIKNVLDTIPGCRLTGSKDDRSPNHASFCFSGINGKMLVKEMSQYGIDVSSGSACSSPSNDPSHVLAACGIDREYLFGGLRVTIGRYNTRKDIDYLISILAKAIKKMREDDVLYNNEAIFISQSEFKKKTESGEILQIIDVRPIKYPKETIPGSIHIPDFRLKSGIKKLDRNIETVVVCYQGDILSPQVQQLLVKKGFVKVKVLKGGMFSYAKFSV